MSSEVNLGYLKYVVNLKKRMNLYRLGGWILAIPRALLFPLILLYSAGLWTVLSLIRSVSGRKVPDAVLRRTVDIEAFAEQYPFHYYPVLAKGYELSYMKDLLADGTIAAEGLLEFAVGEASLSSRIFEGIKNSVIGCDLSPYSLYQCKRFDHFRALIVADVMNPPVKEGTADCILSMNFIHHVSQKSEVLKKWSLIAETTVFNENTSYWASASSWAGILGRIGLKRFSASAAKRKELANYQFLLDESEIDQIVERDYEVVKKISFIHADTMFLSNLSAALMLGVYGPPTPALIRWLSRPFLPLVRATAKELFLWDQSRDRSHDVFILYVGRSRNFVRSAPEPVFFAYDEDSNSFTVDQLQSSRQPMKDGLVFLLSKDRSQIFEAYDVATRAAVSSQHL